VEKVQQMDKACISNFLDDVMHVIAASSSNLEGSKQLNGEIQDRGTLVLVNSEVTRPG
jgi:hypothetical protein